MSRLDKGVNDLKTWCLSNGSWGEQLMREWTGETENNEHIEIDEISRASNKKAKWKCSKGHEWLAIINDRTRKKLGCPYCSGKRVSDMNSLKNWCLNNGDFGKQLMSEWTGEFDGKINVDMSDVARASNNKAKWKCSNGHEWFAKIAQRTQNKTCCPYCAMGISNENNLKIWCLSNGSFGEQLMAEWTGNVDGKKNVSIDKVTKASGKKARWKCSKGHEWFVTINSRTSRKTDCPYCSGQRVSEENNLKTWCLNNGELGKQVMSEWTGEVEDEKNIDISDVTKASHKKAKWKCANGHEWYATIADRTSKKSGCSYCYEEIRGEKVAKARLSEENSLKTWCLSNASFGEQLMSEWTGEVGDKKNISLDDVSFGSNKKAKWRCSNRHEWYATINNRTNKKYGCPICNTWGTSYPEQFIYHSLKQIYPDTKSRAKAYLPGNNRGVEYDISIVSANLCIEYSPTFWHQGKEDRDNYKKEISKQYNFRLIQIVEDSFNELDFAMESDYICFKMNNQLRDETLVMIVDFILKTLGHSISEIDIEKVKKDAYESCKGIENDIQDTD